MVNEQLHTQETIEKIRDMKERMAKRERKRMKYACPGLLVIDETDEKAEQVVCDLTSKIKAFNRIMETGYVGSPETIASKILEKDETCVDYIIFQ